MPSLNNKLRLKLALLTRGLVLPKNEYSGRKGGAGPTQGRYFKSDQDPINVPMYSDKLSSQMNSIDVQNPLNTNWRLPEFGINLQPIPTPSFYQDTLSDRTPMRQIALLHGIDCLATTIIQHCDYWQFNTQCHFCSIPSSYHAGQTVLQKRPEDFLEVLRAANQKFPIIQHITLTNGTVNHPDRGIQTYLDFVKVIRQESNIPIHIQVEPPDSPEMLDDLVDVGVDSIGIHLEIFDDQRRKQYCPGKFQTASYSKYLKTWKYAIDLFGLNQVSTYILLGLNETNKEIINGVQVCADLGVIPLLTPIRFAPKTPLGDVLPSYVQQPNLVELHQQVGSILKDAGISSEMTKAGCARCGGCSAIREAIAVG